MRAHMHQRVAAGALLSDSATNKLQSSNTEPLTQLQNRQGTGNRLTNDAGVEHDQLD